jgi:hypothetical protein
MDAELANTAESTTVYERAIYAERTRRLERGNDIERIK